MSAENHGIAGITAVWGHFAAEVLCASIAAVIIVGLRPPVGVLAATVPLSLVAVVLFSWLLMRRHDRRLCEQCVAAMPLNAAARAVRYQRRFWMAHNGAERRFVLPYLVVLIGSNFFPGTWGRLAWAVIQCSMIYLIMSQMTHRRFQPWCPRCSGGGGGSERPRDVAPVPPSDRDRHLV